MNESVTFAAARNQCTRPGIEDLSTGKCYPFYNFYLLHQDEQLWPLVYGIIFPVLVLATIVANIFVVLVLSKKHMISPTNVVLLYMAIADLFVGIVPFPFTFYYYTLGNYKAPVTRPVEACWMYQILMDTLPPICHNIAMWLTVLLAAQRFVYIQYPMSARSLCTIPRVKRMSAFIVVTAFLCGFWKVFEFQIDVVNGPVLFHNGNNGTISIKNSCITRLAIWIEIIGMNRFYNLFYWTRVILFIAIPSFLLILLNALLIRSIHHAKLRKERLLQQNRRREAQRQNESNTTSIVLVLIVTVFLIVNLPQGMFLALVCVDSTFNLNIFMRVRNFGMIFLPLDNMLILATYPLNFAIYCSLSSQFRETFKRLFCRHLPPIPSASASWGRSFMHRMSRRSISLAMRGRSKTTRNGDMTMDYEVSQTGVSLGNASSPRLSSSKDVVRFFEPGESESCVDLRNLSTTTTGVSNPLCASTRGERTLDSDGEVVEIIHLISPQTETITQKLVHGKVTDL